MAIIQTGSSGTGLANVDANYNLQVRTPTTEVQAGFAQLSSELDSGSVTGSRYVKALESSEDYRLRVGIDGIWFNEWFPGTALSSSVWLSPTTTMTVDVTGGFMRLNAGSSVTTTQSCAVRSQRSFPVFGSMGTVAEIRAQFPQTPQSNNIVEWGIAVANTATPWAPLDGCFFRLNSDQTFKCVVSVNGTEATSAALDFAALVGTNTTRHFIIVTGEDEVHFWIDDVLVAEVAVVAGVGPCASGALPLYFRVANTGAVSAAQQIKVSHASVNVADAQTARTINNQCAGMGGGCHQGQTGGTMGSTANYANSANPTAAVPTNTTAALGSGLGGQFWETDTLAVTTDGVISSYQVPAGTAAIPGKMLYITGIKIASFVQTALTGGGYVAQWSLAVGHTAVSLATTEVVSGATPSKAPRRVPLGLQAVGAGATASTVLSEIRMDFTSPIAVNPGEFVQTVKKKVGTAPSAGVIAHVITVSGYFE